MASNISVFILRFLFPCTNFHQPEPSDVSSVKKTFKSQNLNSLFRQASPERPISTSPMLSNKGSPIGDKLTLGMSYIKPINFPVISHFFLTFYS